MITKKNKVTRDYKVKDLVSVHIPRIDRGGTDFKILPGMISKVSGYKTKWFTILTPFGILNDKFRVSDLEPYYGVVDVNLEQLTSYKPISLKAAAALHASNSGSIDTKSVQKESTKRNSAKKIL